MSLLSIFKSTRGGAGCCKRKSGPGDSAGTAAAAALRDAIESAQILARDPDEDGPRIFVRSLTFQGSFRYSREDAAQRIQRAFPELSEDGIRRAVAQLESRVRLYASPKADPTRPTWMNWRGA